MAKKITLTILVVFWLFLLAPFLGAIGMGAILAVLFYPWMKRSDRWHFPRSLAAGLFTLCITLVLFLPVSALMIGSVSSGLNELKRIKRLDPKAVSDGTSSEVVLDKVFESSGFDALLVRTSTVLPINPTQASNTIKDFITDLSGRIGEVLTIFISRVPNMMVGLAIFLFAFYYFLADGERFLLIIRERSFYSLSETQEIFTVFSGLCRSVILASVITGGLQALLATIVSFAVGIHPFLLVFPVIFVASFVPLIGSFPIVIGLSLYLFFTGGILEGGVMLIAAIIIALMDNFIRPQIIRGGSNLHPLLGFVSALGGLQFFGMTGIFLGPVIGGLMVECFRIVQSDKKIIESK